MSNDVFSNHPSAQIMVVDDDLHSRKLLSDILGKHGYQVRPASSGGLALRSIALEAPDLILLDVKMPEMDGYEVCRHLKADEKSRKIPVIFISALGKTAEKVLGFKAGAVDFITKPYEAQEVLARVGTHLRLRELTEHLEEEVNRRTAELTLRKQAEEERQRYIHYLENLELVDRAIHQSENAEQMLRKVIETVFLIFQCDRTWLIEPCDPEALTCPVPVEVCRPEYPGAGELNIKIPLKPWGTRVYTDTLAVRGPVVYGPQAERQVNKALIEEFGVLSQMTMAVYPRVGKPWLFGLHQCSHPRIWTEEEKKLFHGIGRRLADGLSAMLSLKNLKASEEELKKHRDHLEDMIKERTSELTVANEQLQQGILERKRVEQKLRNYAETQEVLVREVNHRVKNNLSAIIGMLHMEEDRAKADGAIQYLSTLEDLIWRIDGLATVHSLLSASGWQPLEVDDLCRQVVETALRGVPFGKRMRVKVMPTKIQINSNQAHHLTLIINELATNSMKYAFGSRDEANITIDFHQHESSLTIVFRDDGPGYSEKILQDDFKLSSIGFELIRGIVRRSLNGTVDFGNDNGAFASIVFNNELH